MELFYDGDMNGGIAKENTGEEYTVLNRVTISLQKVFGNCGIKIDYS